MTKKKIVKSREVDYQIDLPKGFWIDRDPNNFQLKHKDHKGIERHFGYFGTVKQAVEKAVRVGAENDIMANKEEKEDLKITVGHYVNVLQANTKEFKEFLDSSIGKE